MDVMNGFFNAAILGVVEGITEFLPISSTGHLIVTADWLGVPDTDGVFEIVIQLGAVLAVAWFYRQDLFSRLAALPKSKEAQRFWLNLMVAFLPAGVFGLTLGKLVTEHLFSPTVVATSLILGGIVLWIVEMRPQAAMATDPPTGATATLEAPRTTSLESLTVRQALVIGLAQVLALVPGVSRSGSSIVGGLLAGLDRKTATAFSFYLALPTLGGATLYSFFKNMDAIMSQGNFLALAVGTVTAFITALLCIRWLLGFVAHHDFRGFAIYRIAAGLALLAWIALR